jgi:arsenate reductase (thioredoxin)
MADKAFNVLFLGDDNSARSIMAEALLKRFGEGRFRAFSAGLVRAPSVDATTMELIRGNNLPSEGLTPKTISELLSNSAPEMDFVISVCEGAAPAAKSWPGDAFKASWGISNPLAEKGDTARQKRAFAKAFRELENRVRLFVLVRHPARARASASRMAEHQNPNP